MTKKINKQLNERGFWDTVMNLGRDTPAAAPAASAVDARAKNQFIDRTNSRLLSAFNNAFKMGQIDVNAGGSTPAAAPAAAPAGGMQSPPGVNPATGKPFAGKPQGGAKAAPGAPKAAAPGPAARGNAAVAAGQKQGTDKPQVDVNVDKAVNTMRTLQPSGTKPLPGKNAAELNKTLQLVSKNKDYLLLAADKIAKFNQAGYDMKPFHKSFMAQFALGKKQKTIQEEYMLSESEFISFEKYSSWDNMLYSILNEQAAPGAVSPSAYIMPLIKQALRGYNLEKSSNYNTVVAALQKWEDALKAQVQKSGGQFKGMDGNTQKAWNTLMDIVADTAFASLSTGGGQGQQPQQSQQGQQPGRTSP